MHATVSLKPATTPTTPLDTVRCNPLAGSNHCIGTSHSVINLLFRYLQSKCAANGGTLTDAELKEAQSDLVDGWQSMFDLFGDIHDRCMVASGADAPMMFAKGRMLSSLLFACSHEAAGHVFGTMAKGASYGQLDYFYDILAKLLRRHVAADAESRLTGAYVRASLAHGQTLTVEKLLREQTVKDVLRECLQPFEFAAYPETLIAALADKIKAATENLAGDAARYSNEISLAALRCFVSRFPREIRIAVGGRP
jgi:hypothetical protein